MVHIWLLVDILLQIKRQGCRDRPEKELLHVHYPSFPSNRLKAIATYLIKSLLKMFFRIFIRFFLNMQSFSTIVYPNTGLLKFPLITGLRARRTRQLIQDTIWCQVATGLADISSTYYTTSQFGHTARKINHLAYTPHVWWLQWCCLAKGCMFYFSSRHGV